MALRAPLGATLVSIAIVGASLGVAACDRIVDPPLPSDAEQFLPPAIYSTWWEMTQACSGQTRSLASVTWYQTNEPQVDPRTGEQVIGYWSLASNRIVMAASAKLLGGAVRHEMLHALLQEGRHSRGEFLGKCAGTVDCQQACILDAGPFPNPPQQPIRVAASDMALTVAVDPPNPDGQNGGFFTITVSAHNPSNSWATVAPVFAETDTLTAFGFDVRGQGGDVHESELALDPSQRIFAPGETKKMVFDFRIGDAPFGHQIQAGSYNARGGFSDFWSGDVPFVVQ
jgi:hypothetical protein